MGTRDEAHQRPTLVVGGTGKTGRRVVKRLAARQEIARATGREIRYVQVSPEQYASALAEHGIPADTVWLMNYLFTTVLDGRNARLSDGVRRASGREPRDFAAYARDAAATGVWDARR